MNRRARLPGADELFRATGAPEASGANNGAGLATGPAGASGATESTQANGFGEVTEVGRAGHTEQADNLGRADFVRVSGVTPLPAATAERPGPSAVRPVRIARHVPDARPTGRERHEEKITVYCSPEELLQLEQARLTLRGAHGMAVDRGRIVREAIAVVLADLEAKGDASILVRRLRGR